MTRYPMIFFMGYLIMEYFSNFGNDVRMTAGQLRVMLFKMGIGPLEMVHPDIHDIIVLCSSFEYRLGFDSFRSEY